jgi:hypothetical protein
MASLDHAMWFQRPFRADEWLLYVSTSPTASGSRGLATGRFYAQDGRHVVSVVQEGMIRVGAHDTPLARPARSCCVPVVLAAESQQDQLSRLDLVAFPLSWPPNRNKISWLIAWG